MAENQYALIINSEADNAGSVNDDRSPLLDLITCIGCRSGMRLERGDPDGNSNDLIRYRCRLCGGTEVLRLHRRAW
jgi:hypothetical protein